PTRAVERLSVAYEDAQRTVRHGCWYAHGNPAHNSVAAIWTQHRFHCDLVTGAGFCHISAGVFQHRRMAVTLQFEFEIYARYSRRLERIVVDPAKVVAQRHGHSECCRLAVCGGKHVGQADIRESVYMDSAVHPIRGFLAV